MYNSSQRRYQERPDTCVYLPYNIMTWCLGMGIFLGIWATEWSQALIMSSAFGVFKSCNSTAAWRFFLKTELVATEMETCDKLKQLSIKNTSHFTNSRKQTQAALVCQSAQPRCYLAIIQHLRCSGYFTWQSNQVNHIFWYFHNKMSGPGHRSRCSDSLRDEWFKVRTPLVTRDLLIYIPLQTGAGAHPAFSTAGAAEEWHWATHLMPW